MQSLRDRIVTLYRVDVSSLVVYKEGKEIDPFYLKEGDKVSFRYFDGGNYYIKGQKNFIVRVITFCGRCKRDLLWVSLADF